MAVSFINIKANHELRPEVSLSEWFGVKLTEKTFLSVANVLVLNSLLFLGEIAQILTVRIKFGLSCHRV